MSQKLGALFISAALGPVTYAGSCIMAQRVKDGLAELNPDSLMGGVNRGVATIADATGLPSEHIERLLPMPQLRRLAERIGPKQRTALTQWDIHTSHIGGLLAGVADLTVDGRAPDTALCLMRLSQKMQMDKALALPLRELSEDLESWRHLLETCRMIINDGDSLRSAHLQRRILRGGFAIAGLLAVAAVVVWIVRVRSARQRIDDLLIASDPCASISIDDSDRGKASEDQRKMLEKRATECETKRAAEREAERLRQEEEAKKAAAAEAEAKARRDCEALGEALRNHRDVSTLAAAKGHEALLRRITEATLTVEDLSGPITLPCPEDGLDVVAAPVFARFALEHAGEWIGSHRLSEQAEALIVKGKDAVSERQRMIFKNSVAGLADKTILMGGEEPMARIRRLCSLLDGLETPARQQCDAVKTASH